MKNIHRFFSLFIAAIMLFSVFSYELAAAAADGTEGTAGNTLNAAAEAETLTYYINYYIQGTTTSVYPSVVKTGPYDGTYLDAVAPDIPGYMLTPFDSSPVHTLLSSTNNVVNFYYVARIYTLTFQSNGGTPITSVTQGYNTTIQKPTDPLKQYYSFLGWYTDAACTHPVSWPFNMPLNGGTLYARWSQTPITLSFNSNNGSVVSPVIALPGSLIQKPANPTRAWFRFDGWFFDISFVRAVTWPLSMPTAATTLYAKWTYIRNTITFNSNGGTDVSQITAPTDFEVSQPSDPSRQGYTFAGWYYDNTTFMNEVSWPIIMPDIGFTVYAKWVPNLITLTFDSQGGTAVEPITDYADTPVTPPEPPIKYGYVFSGWSLGGKPYSITTMPTIDTDLVAAWTATSRFVQGSLQTYKTVNGLQVPADKARAGDILTVKFTPSTNFYCGASRFIIMYDSSFYTIVGSGAAAFTVNTANNYYANAISSYSGTTASPVSAWPSTFVDGESSRYKFAAVNFTASYNSANLGYPVMMDDGTWLFSIQLEVKDNAAGTGRIFMDSRWDRSPDYVTGGQYYYYCASNTIYSTAGNSILDFDSNYANAVNDIAFDSSVPVYSSITIDNANGSPPVTTSGEIGTPFPTPADPSRPGYTFTGWVPAMPSVYQETDTTVVAQWEANTYNAYFYVPGNPDPIATVPTLCGQPIIPPSTNPTKTGNTFSGWSPAVGLMGPSDMRFDAVFTPNIYDATFKVDGVVYAVVPTAYGAPIIAPPNPTKTGYSFKSWSPATLGVMTIGGRTFVAQFTINTYTARFLVDGSVYATYQVVYNSQIPKPADPSKPGFTFTSWSLPVGKMPGQNTDFIAQWQSLQSTITFISNGGTAVSSITADNGSPVQEPAAPTRDYYTFAGWFSDPELETQVTWPFTISTDVTFYAKWDRVPVTLSAISGSTAIIDLNRHFIYGLRAGMVSSELAGYIKVNGDGNLNITSYAGSFGTGTKIELMDNDTGLVVDTYYIVIFGDLDGDGNITAADVNLARMAASYQTAFETGSAFEYAADVAQDGIVDAFDLNIIRATGYGGVINQANPGI